MKRSIILTLALTIISTVPLLAQQNAQYSQYMFHGLYINPAYAGYKSDLNLHSYYRTQWTNMDGGPKTLAFAADMATAGDKVGLGFNIVNDRIGGERRTASYFNYSYRLRFNESGANRLAIGIGAGFVYGTYDEMGVITDQPEPISLESTFLPDVRIGVFYYTPQFFVGAGADNLLSSVVFNDRSASIQPARHYYVQGGGLIPLADAFLLKPSTLIKTASNTEGRQAWTVDLNAAIIIAEQFSVGASYRSGFFTGGEDHSNLSTRNSMIGLAEFVTKNRIRVGYSFDYPLSSTISNLGGTHEISIGYSISKQQIRERTPRFF